MNAISKPAPRTVALDPVVIPAEAYISPDYARAEYSRLWKKVWQVACREEEIPKVGDYVTYDILDESVIVVRTGADEIRAFFNVCQHRGRRITEGCGHTARFHCRYHGWQWKLDGENAHILNPEEWGGALTPENTRLRGVQVGRWAGFVFVNLSADPEPFETFLDALPHWIDPLEVGQMRYKWRRWTTLKCNWKVPIEAFVEGYHTDATHPQVRAYMAAGCWSRTAGRHACYGKPQGDGGIGSGALEGGDQRKNAIAATAQSYEITNALSTTTFVAAANKLMEALPETASAPAEVTAKMTEIAREIDRERGVIWPDVSREHMREVGIDWHIFPNTVLLPNVTYAMGLRVRPNGHDPDSCIFEAFGLERFPPGAEPHVELVHEPQLTEDRWLQLMFQDFANMQAVQLGMKSEGFQGPRPNPVQETSVIHFHRNLADYMGSGAPQPLAQS